MNGPPLSLESLEIPIPVIDVAIEPKTKADQDKLGQALGRIMAEDPSFRVHTDHADRTDHHCRDG